MSVANTPYHAKQGLSMDAFFYTLICVRQEFGLMIN